MRRPGLLHGLDLLRVTATSCIGTPETAAARACGTSTTRSTAATCPTRSAGSRTASAASSAAAPAANACPGGGGPCGGEVHCEGMVMAETGWDLMTRDLLSPPFNYYSQRAHEVAARLIYLGAQPVELLVHVLGGRRLLGDGRLPEPARRRRRQRRPVTDGTPHMTAIRAAFERHEIHCATPAPVNSGCADVADAGARRSRSSRATGPSSRPGRRLPNATGYLVYRGDGIDGCNFGRPIIANTAELSFLDQGLANGRQLLLQRRSVRIDDGVLRPDERLRQAAPVGRSQPDPPRHRGDHGRRRRRVPGQLRARPRSRSTSTTTASST